MLQKLKVTSTIALVALFLLLTAHQSNAFTKSQDVNTLININHDYLPNYAVNSIDSEQTGIKLARSWGHNKRIHYCKRKRRGRLPQSRYCRSYRARHAAKARARIKRRMMSRLKKMNRYNFNSKSKDGRDLNSIFKSRKNSRQRKEQLKAKPVPQQRRGTQQTGGRKVYTNERRMAPVYTAKKKGEKLYSTHKTRKECIERFKKRTNGVWGERQAERFCGPCDSSRLINYHLRSTDSIIKNVCMPTWGYNCVKSKGCRGTPDLCQKSSQNGCYLNADYTIMKPQPKGTGDCNPSCLK